MSEWDITLDKNREARLGFDEAVYCEGKQLDQLRRILEHALECQCNALLTRLRPDRLAALPTVLRERIDYDELSRTGFFGEVQAPTTATCTAVVSAGSSDVAVAQEAVRTLYYYGQTCRQFHDVGVAGLWRLLERIEQIRVLPVVIAVAGMDAALPSVLAGLVPAAVIAVPVSNGYGVAAGGHTALNAALSSCAPGLTVVNIDNGYGAACAALRMVRAISRNGNTARNIGGGLKHG